MARDQKNAFARRATVAFLDESGFSFRPLALRTWAPRGKTPILVSNERSRVTLSAVSALTWRPRVRCAARRFGLSFRAHDETIKSPQVIDFLRHLLRQLRGHIELVWDRLSAHQSSETRRFLSRHPRLHIHELPPYSPDLNPVEYEWAHLKKNGLAHYAPEHRSHLHAALRRSVCRLQPRRHVLSAFFRAAGLSTAMDEGQ